MIDILADIMMIYLYFPILGWAFTPITTYMGWEDAILPDIMIY